MVHAELNQIKQITAELLRNFHVLMYISKKWMQYIAFKLYLTMDSFLEYLMGLNGPRKTLWKAYVLDRRGHGSQWLP